LKGAPAWALAVALGGLGIALRFRFAVWLDQTPFLPFFPPVALTALLCGWRQATVLLAVCTAVAAHFFFRLQPQGDHATFEIMLRLAGFLCVGGVFIAVIAAMDAAIRRLRAAVDLQESLFRELQHRVANNMQVVAAMLAQTRRAIEDPAASALVELAEVRIHSMGELHRRLHDPRGLAGGLEALLRDYLADLFQDVPVRISLHIGVHDLSVDQVMLVVLLVVEAAANAAKHVFRAGQGTCFAVSLAPLEDGRLRLRIADDGPGFAAADAVAGPKASKLGMGIMQSLAQQLGGRLDMADAPGTTLSVDFARARQDGLLF
jgi:two-component sensor histidine kinase